MMRIHILVLFLALLAMTACGDDKKVNQGPVYDIHLDAADDQGGPGPDSKDDPDSEIPDQHLSDLGPSDIGDPEDVEDLANPQDIEPFDNVVPGGCGFDYDFPSWQPDPQMTAFVPGPWSYDPEQTSSVIDRIAWPDPDPPATYRIRPIISEEELTMPDYYDNMPLFERAEPFNGSPRCYEIPGKSLLLSESEAYDMYADIAEMTTGHKFDAKNGRRSVIGLRGTYPGTFEWNGNGPNRFNDTLVLLWRESNGTKRVLEFAAHTDTGPYDWGWHNSSSLWPNRHYPYRCGWHKTYNALSITIEGYQVRDDTNKNAHWDSDRNEWLPPLPGLEGDDHDRPGSAHNIHMASVDGPLYTAEVANWSAGCQVIPGRASWTRFITNAWTEMGAEVDYYLVDVRDIDPRVWLACEPDGTHDCPFRVTSLPYSHQYNTTNGGEKKWGIYNCSPAKEEGSEVIYIWSTQTGGSIKASVDDIADDVGPDVDIHLLMGDDPNACLARDNISLTYTVPPGRYVFIVDTYSDSNGQYPGSYTLTIEEVLDSNAL